MTFNPNDYAPTPTTIEEAIQQRNNWIESAALFSRNEEFYRGILDKIAREIGVEAFIADDGTVNESPIRLKLPELVKKIFKRALSRGELTLKYAERLKALGHWNQEDATTLEEKLNG